MTAALEDARSVRHAFRSGDFDRALDRIGEALENDPVNPEWLRLLDAGLEIAEDPLARTDLDHREPTVGSAAVRAFALAREKKWLDAVSLVTDLTALRPDVPYLAWTWCWLREEGVLGKFTFEEMQDHVLLPIVKNLPSSRGPDDPCEANLKYAAAICELIRARHPDRGFVYYAAQVVAQRLRKYVEAVSLAKKAYALDPCFLTCIGLARALGRAGRILEAAARYQEARRFDPEDVSTYLDVGDLLMENSRFPEATEAYRKILEKDPSNPHAHFRLICARWHLRPNDDDWTTLRMLREGQVEDPALVRLIDQVERARSSST